MSNALFTDIKTIFFDTADTMYHNPDMEAAYPQKLVELLADSRKIPTQQAKDLLKQTAENLKGTAKHVTKVRTMAELGFSRAEVHEAFCKVDPKEFLNEDRELDLLMEQLSSKYKLGIISNFKRSHVLEILSALSLSASWFPLLITEDIVKEIKPDHEPFIKAIELSGYEANQCLYVGDSPTKDMQPAKEVDMKTVLIADNPTNEDLLHADMTIANVKGIQSLLKL